MTEIIEKKILLNTIIIDVVLSTLNTNIFREELPNGVKHVVAYNSKKLLQNSQKFIVPKDHYFLLGDNRDCSNDSRFDNVGYVKKENLIGKAQLIIFSNDTLKGSMFKFWQLNKSFRVERFLKGLNENNKELEKILDYKFKNPKLLFQSLIHKSFNNMDNNEKLEFLGDRVLGLIISKNYRNLSK